MSPSRAGGDGLPIRIERLIAERGLRPGDRLPPERELAHLLGVSRPSLREAVRTLEATGRVHVRHGSGVWLLPPDGMRALLQAREVTLRELFAMREVLEVPGAGWAAAAPDPAAVSRLRAALEAMARTEDPAELRRLDIEFHLTIAEMAGNRFLVRTMGVLHEMLRGGMETTLTIAGRLQRSRVEHRRILEAIEAGSPADARHAMRAHIQSAQRAGLARLGREEAGA